MNTLLVLVILHAVTCFQPSSKRYKDSRGYSSSNRLNVKNGLEDHQLDRAINNPIKYEKTPQIVLGHKRTDLLLALWEKVSFPDKYDSEENIFKLSDYGLNRNTVQSVLDHFNSCKDVALDNAFLMAMQDNAGEDILVLSNVRWDYVQGEDPDGQVFGQEDYSDFLEQFEEEDGEQDSRDVFPIEKDDNIVMRDTRIWVQTMIAGMQVCPFTVDPDKAGIPLGGVRYRISRAETVDEAFFRYWEELKLLQTVDEKEISTVLLIFPEIELFGNYEVFEAYCDGLSDSLSSATGMGMDLEFQLVFFHPKYTFRDGNARLEKEKGAANFARRGPWPMINILRTNQVRAAQKGVPTGLVYKQNEERLTEIGTNVLEEMLYNRNWDNLPWINPRAPRPIKDAKESEINWKSVSPLHFSSSPKGQSDLGESTGKCPFSKSEQDEILKTNTIDEIEAQKEHFLTTQKSDERKLSSGSTLANAMETIDKKSKSGKATDADYAEFADEISKWLEMEEAKESLDYAPSLSPTPPSSPTAHSSSSPKIEKSQDVDW